MEIVAIDEIDAHGPASTAPTEVLPDPDTPIRTTAGRPAGHAELDIEIPPVAPPSRDALHAMKTLARHPHPAYSPAG